MSSLCEREAIRSSGNQRVVFRPAQRQGSLAAWIVVPDRHVGSRPAIVSVHGLARNAREQAVLLAHEAVRHGDIVCAPHFDAVQWKRYQQLVERGRADLALITLLEELRSEYPTLPREFVLAGFSGGAQFAHRFAMLHPQLVQRLVITSAGWYTFPSNAPYPYGLGDRIASSAQTGSAFAANLDAFLQLPVKVAVGALDDAPDATLRRGKQLDRVQGVGRLTRARRWVDAMRAAARERGIEPRTSLRVLEHCAHDFAMCVRIGGLDRCIFGPAYTEVSQ